MDADQWVALNEMLVKPQPTEGDVATIDGSTDLSALHQQQQPVYTQSVLRPDLLQGTAVAEGGGMVWEGGDQAADQQQQIYYAGAGGEGSMEAAAMMGGGEDKLYAVVDGVVYEVVTGEGGEQMLVPAQHEGGGPLSLEDLAAVSGGGEQDQAAVDAAAAVEGGEQLQQQYVQHVDGGVLVGAGDGQVATTVVDSNGQQFIVMQQPQQLGDAADAGGARAIKVGGQDFVLPPGMQLPPELQEMVAKGLPIDLSNYEFVIEGGTGGSVEPISVSGQYLTDGSASAGVQFVDASGNHVSASNVVNPNDVLSMLAEASSAVARRDQRGGPVVTAGAKQWATPGSMAQQGALLVNNDAKRLQQQQQEQEQRRQLLAAMFAADENEDGEFDYVAETVPNGSGVVVVPPAPKSSGYLESFVGFVNGNRAETLSSLASSTIIRRPPVVLPSYGRSGSVVRGGNVGRGVARGGAGVNRGGRGRPGGRGGMQVSVTPFTVQQSPQKESTIINRRRKGSDTDSDGGLDDEDAVAIGNARGKTDSDGSMSGYILEVGPQAGNKQNNDTDEKTEPHSYQKGEFVVEWKDAYKIGGFPIWKIESGRLLQKYDPVEKDGVLLHKSASIYSSWSGDIRQSFKGIQVELINSAGRRQELVRVLDKYLPKPIDESLETDPLMELFNVYVQSLLSEAIEPNFLANVRIQQEEYYLGPLTQIDTLLEEAEKSALSLVNWSERFKAYADQFPHYKITPITGERVSCSAWAGVERVQATHNVLFYGQTYDRDLLTPLDNMPNVTQQQAEVHPVGGVIVEHLPTYHALHHFKYLLLNKCRQEVQYRKHGKDKTGNIILEECLQNRIWIQQNLLQLKELLQKCSIVVTVVTKADESS